VNIFAVVVVVVGWLVGWIVKVERIFKDRMETNE
jgi:hypothetical protein